MTQDGHFEGARRLLRGCRFGSLATLDRDGAPFASLVATAGDARGMPLLLLSNLAVHTANLTRDGRASLLLDGSEGARERLAAPRLTLTGHVERLETADPDTATARRRYLARHPSATMLLELADFNFYRLVPQAGHLVAGFGRIGTIPASELLVDEALAVALAGSGEGAIAHMHADHADAVELMAGGAPASIAALDADGMDLLAGETPVRRDFAARLGAIDALRGAVVELVRSVRMS